MKLLAEIGCALAVIAGSFAVVACDDKKAEPAPIPLTTTTPTSVASPFLHASATPPSSTAATPRDVGYDAPKKWEVAANPNPMRKATFKVPKAAGDTEDAELTVSSASGGVDANVKRWAGQFGNATPKVDAKTVNGLKVSLVEIKGTYSSGGMMGAPGAPKEKQMLLGAIVDLGESQTFFKLVGPEKTVTASRPDFDEFVGSFRAK